MIVASGWPSVPLGELVEPGRAITYGVVQPGAPVAAGVPIVRVSDIRGGRVLTGDALRISPEIESAYGRSRLRGGELLLTVVGSIGQTAIAPDDLAGWNTARGVAVIPVRRDVGASWVRIALESPEVRSLIQSRLNTTVQATLNLADVAELPVPMPPPVERERILRQVGTLDKKIELSRRMSQTLELMARALFKAWFVDFERAATDGSTPARLELGSLPGGWRVAVLGEVCEVVDCSHATKPKRKRVGRPLLQLSNIGSDGLLSTSDLFPISDFDYEAWTARIEASPGDCVITNVGRVGAVAQVPSRFRGALGRNMTAVRCRPDWPFPTYLIHAMTSRGFSDEIASKTDAGTVLDALNVRNIPLLRIVVPPAPVLEAYEVAIRPLQRRREQLLLEADALADIRNRLLPVLIASRTSAAP